MSKKKPTLYEIAQGKQTLNPVDDIEAEIVQEDRELAREARRLRLEEIVERRKQKLKQLKGSDASNKQIAQVGTGLLSSYMQMAQVDPARAKEFLDSLTKEDIAKISLLSASGQGGGANIQALLPFIKSKDTSIQDIVSIVKMVHPESAKPMTVGDVTSLWKVIQENKGQARQQDNPYPKLLERALDEAKAYREEMSKREYMRQEKEIAELKNRPSFEQEVAKKKAEFEAFKESFGGGGTPNIELEKMKLDQNRWMFEQKYQQQKDYQEMQNKRASEKERNKLIRDIAVPAVKKLVPMVDAAVNAGKRKMGSIANPETSAKQLANAFLCPECAKKDVETIIDVSSKPNPAICPTCKAEFPMQQEGTS